MSREARAVRSQFKVWQSFTTRWADNDAYGHVNNTVFYQRFDSAVNAWLEPLAFPESVDVGLAVARLGRSSVRYRIGVFAAGAETAAAQGEFVHVLVDRASRRPVEIPANWRRALEAIS